MYKIILTLIFILLFCGISLAHGIKLSNSRQQNQWLTNDSFLYFEIDKQTNSSYAGKFPALEMSFQYNYFLIEPELALIFTAPRNNAKSWNHHSVSANLNMGLQMPSGFFGTVSFGLDYPFEGNSDSLPSVPLFKNILRGGYKWN